jgi:hypothetical protein
MVLDPMEYDSQLPEDLSDSQMPDTQGGIENDDADLVIAETQFTEIEKDTQMQDSLDDQLSPNSRKLIAAAQSASIPGDNVPHFTLIRQKEDLSDTASNFVFQKKEKAPQFSRPIHKVLPTESQLNNIPMKAISTVPPTEVPSNPPPETQHEVANSAETLVPQTETVHLLMTPQPKDPVGKSTIPRGIIEPSNIAISRKKIEG